MDTSTDIDMAIQEFELAIGYEIRAIQRERYARCLTEIAKLTARIERLRRQHKRTVERWMTKADAILIIRERQGKYVVKCRKMPSRL